MFLYVFNMIFVRYFPEYAFMGKASRKCDIFSFGIMLLETFSGKRPTDPMFSGGLSLRQWVSQAFPARLGEVSDDKILQDEATHLCFDHQTTNTSIEFSSSNKTNGHFLASIFDLALICSSESPEQRIGMTDVVAKLQEIKDNYVYVTPGNTKSSHFYIN
jgi:serine/threonine protein kinase